MTWRTRRAVGRGAWWAAAAVGVVCLGGCSRPVLLVPGEAVEGELSPDGSAVYSLELGSGEYVRLVVAPQTPDGELALRVVAPDDRPLIEAAGIHDEYAGLAAWITDAAGDHRIEIDNPNPATSTAYRLVVEEVRPQREGDEHRAAAQRAGAEAARLAARDEVDQAIAALERALEDWRRAGDAALMAEILIDIVSLQWLADPDAAVARSEEALALSTAAALPWWRIEALNWQGRILRRRADCAGAQAAYDEALAIARASGELEQAAVTAFNRAVLLKDCAPDRAPAAFEELVAEAQRAGDATTEAIGLRELAAFARNEGDLAEARDLIERAWRRAEASKDRVVQADVSHERGNLDRWEGRLEEAVENYRRCLTLTETRADRRRVVDVLLSLGALALDLRRPEEAWEHYQDALAAAEALGDPARQSEALRELGIVLFRQTEYARAEEYFLRALSTAERLGEGEARTERMAAARFGLGNALLEEGEPAGAVDQLEAALTAWVSTGNRLEEALTRTALGAALGRLGERSAAHEHLTAALAINRAQGERLRTAWSLYRLAELLAQERPDEARRAIEEAIDLSRHVRSGLFSPPLQAGFSEGSRRFYELYVNLLVDQGDTPAAFAASERGRAQALLDLITDARVDLTARADPALRLSAQELDLRIARLQRGLSDVVAPGGDERRAAAVRSELERAEEEWWRVQAAIRERLPGHRQVHQTETLTVEDARALLPPGLALLEYWIGEDRSYVFVLTRDALSLLRLPAAREIRSDVAAFRSALLRMGPAAEFAASANRLYEVLVAPALSGAAANGRIDDVIVVPDGSLHLLPFEALVTSPAGRSAGYRDLDYLLRTVTVSYVPSASVLANLERRKSVAGDDRPPDIRFVAFADPAYDSPVALDCPVPGVEATNSSAAVRSEQLERLRGSGREVEVIAARYPGRSRVYEGADATEARFKTAAEVATAERLHVAVHGVACESFPERSGLVFALDGGDGQDGILQTREIFNLDLSADLVVLSACETGLGRLVSGEGVVGLARAFFYSGARSLVVSLWPVSDRSTARLMASFYDSLDRGDDKAEALRQAQLGLVDAGGRDAAPFHWAPFVLLGSREQTTAGTAVTIEAP